MKVPSVGYVVSGNNNNNNKPVNFGQSKAIVENFIHLGVKKYDAIGPIRLDISSFAPTSIISDTKPVSSFFPRRVIKGKYVRVPERAIVNKTVVAGRNFDLKGVMAQSARVATETFHSFVTAFVQGRIKVSERAILDGRVSGANIRAKTVSIGSSAIVKNSDILAKAQRIDGGKKTYFNGGDLGVSGTVIDSKVHAMGHIHFESEAYMRGGSLSTDDELFIWGKLEDVRLSAKKAIHVFVARENLKGCTFEPGSKIVFHKPKKINLERQAEKAAKIGIPSIKEWPASPIPRIVHVNHTKPAKVEKPKVEISRSAKDDRREQRMIERRASRRKSHLLLRELAAAIDL